MNVTNSDDRYLTEHLDRLRRQHQGHNVAGAPRRSPFASLRRSIAATISTHIRPGDRVLDVGCGDGTLLADSPAAHTVGVDLDSHALAQATATRTNFTPLEGAIEHVDLAGLGPFDVIVMSGVLEELYDIQTVLQRLHPSATSRTRLVIASYSRIAQPVLRLLELLKLRDTPAVYNWVPPGEIRNMLEQSGFELITVDHRVLVPFHVPVLSRLVNRWIAPLPLFRSLCLVTITTARPVATAQPAAQAPSVSVVIAARNEAGNIAPLLDRIPVLSPRQEVILVEGGSSDDTWPTIQRELVNRPTQGYPFVLVAAQQPGKGKADAVREGFRHATGDILIILDADISVPPEELPRFIDLLRSGTCEFANGSRLVYPMDDEAMRFLNLVGNRLFGMLFSYLLGQPIRDTLCGTKALWASDYRRIEQGRSYFGDFDPFGDFDLLFGAARLGLRIRDVPVHYKERVYGSTNISRFRHGLLLLKMSAIAARRLRFTPH